MKHAASKRFTLFSAWSHSGQFSSLTHEIPWWNLRLFTEDPDDKGLGPEKSQ